MEEYLFIVDEKGDPGLARGASRYFVLGGYVVAESKLQKVEDVWQQFKKETCGTSDVELKSEHFFASRSKHNPLIIRNRQRRGEIAMRGLELIYDIPSVAPLAYCVFKERASEDLIVDAQSGNQRIDTEKTWIAPLGLFVSFLENKRTAGKVLHDELSGDQEHNKKNLEWRALKRSGGASSVFDRIADEILFLDSKANQAIQVADFLCGVLWQAMDGDEVYLSRFLDKYSARKRRDGLGIIILE